MKLSKANLAAILVTAELVTGGCGTSSAEPQPTAPSSGAVSPAVAARPSRAPVFQLPPTMCELTGDFESFKDLYPGAQVDKREGKRTEAASFSGVTCSAGLGKLPSGLLLFVDAEVFRDDTRARAQYEGFKELASNSFPDVRDVDGIGTEAYIYTDPVLGARLTILHGNLDLEVRVTRLASSASLPADVQQRLGKVAAHVLANMPTA